MSLFVIFMMDQGIPIRAGFPKSLPPAVESHRRTLDGSRITSRMLCHNSEESLRRLKVECCEGTSMLKVGSLAFREAAFFARLPPTGSASPKTPKQWHIQRSCLTQAGPPRQGPDRKLLSQKGDRTPCFNREWTRIDANEDRKSAASAARVLTAHSSVINPCFDTTGRALPVTIRVH